MIKEINAGKVESTVIPIGFPDLKEGILSALADTTRNYNEVYDLFKEKSLNYQSYSQDSTGYCWLMSTLACVSDYVIKKYGSEDVRFSKKHLVFYDKIEKSNLFLEHIISTITSDIDSKTVRYILTRGISDRGQFSMAKVLIEKYGLVPVEETEDERIRVNTGELNACLSMILRNDAYILRRMHYFGSGQEEILKAKKEMLNEITKILIATFGYPVSCVKTPDYISNASDRWLKPIDFYKKYVDYPFDEYVSIINDGKSTDLLYVEDCVKLDGFSLVGHYNSFIHVTDKVFFSAITNQIEDGVPCWIGCDAGKFSFWKRNIFDDSSIDFSKICSFIQADTFAKNTVFSYGIASITHSLVFVDRRADAMNMYWWRALNSSALSGKVSYCSQSWFEKYVFQAIVCKKYLADVSSDMSCIQKRYMFPWELSNICM